MTSPAFKANYSLIDWSDLKPRQRKARSVHNRSSAVPLPMLVRPFSEPVQSMADGKFYDDPASLRSSYKADNNPHGCDFIEVGNEDITKFEAPKKDRKAQRDAIERAINDVANGNAPPVLTTDEHPI